MFGFVAHATQFILGHAWPSGSIGLPHHVHSGRPDSITWAACVHEGVRLTARDVDPNVPAVVVVEEFAVLVDGTSLELEEHLVVRAVVAEPDRAEHEHRVDRRGEFHCTGDRTVLRRREVGQHLGEVLRDRGSLLLLALDGDTRALGPDLEEERPLAGAADRADRELVDVVEFVEHTHVVIAGPSVMRGAVR